MRKHTATQIGKSYGTFLWWRIQLSKPLEFEKKIKK
jgi:hypothetical protein